MQFMTNKSALQKILKEVLSTENKDKNSQERMGLNKFHEMS
jgi:hypothetical protein